MKPHTRMVRNGLLWMRSQEIWLYMVEPLLQVSIIQDHTTNTIVMRQRTRYIFALILFSLLIKLEMNV